MITQSTKNNLMAYKGKPEIVFVSKKVDKGCHDVKGELLKAIKQKDIELVLLILSINDYKASVNKYKKVVITEKSKKDKNKDIETPIVYSFSDTSLTIKTKNKQYVIKKFIPLKDRLITYLQKTNFRNNTELVSSVIRFLRKEK